ncbi:MAG: hypothetical protein NUW37_02140 [Planctomycetes bacterium]|nr:hypothetical protein [Planctomycetota bacterium]
MNNTGYIDSLYAQLDGFNDILQELRNNVVVADDNLTSAGKLLDNEQLALANLLIQQSTEQPGSPEWMSIQSQVLAKEQTIRLLTITYREFEKDLSVAREAEGDYAKQLLDFILGIQSWKDDRNYRSQLVTWLNEWLAIWVKGVFIFCGEVVSCD